MGEEGADADHVEVELFEEFDVAGQHLVGLAGNAHHDAAADLVADLAQFAQDRDAVSETSPLLGMDGSVERGVGCLEAQQIAIGAGFAPQAQLV